MPQTYDFNRRYVIRIELNAIAAADSSSSARTAADQIATLIEDLENPAAPGWPLVEIVRIEVEQRPAEPRTPRPGGSPA